MLKPVQDSCVAPQTVKALVAGARGQAEVAKQSLATLHKEPFPEIPGYQITREVHRGGQGVVYQGVQESTTQIVAIKVLYSGVSASQLAQHRFRSEVESLAALKHPNVVRLHDGGCASGRYFLVMDLVRGQPLGRYLCAEDLAPDQLLKLFQGMCRGVEAAHQRGIIHRDLKPSNVLVDAGGTPHIVDFGLARILREDAGPTEAVTAEGRFVGSLAWAAPEQVTGRPEEIDVRTDVSALGLLLFLIITGEPPRPECGSLHELVKCIVEEEPPRPGQILPGTPRELDAIVLKCLERSKTSRYQTVSALLDDVRRYRRGEPISAAQYSTTQLARKFLRRHWVMSSVAAALFLIVLGYAATVTHLLGRTRAAEQVASSATADYLETLAFVVQEISNRLRELPGGRETRDHILHDAFNRLHALQAEHSSPAIAERIGLAELELGDIALTLGRHEEASALFGSALRVFRELSLDGSDSRLLRKFSLALVRRGDVHKAKWEFEEAGRLYKEALEIDESLAAHEPGELAHVRWLVWSYERCGWIAEHCGDLELAASRRAQQQELAEQLVRLDPNQPVHLHAMLSSCGQRAGLVPPGNDDLKRSILLKGLGAGEKLLEIKPSHAEYQHLTASTYAMLVITELSLGMLDDGLAHANRAAELANGLFELDAESRHCQELLALCLFVKAKILDAMGAADSAIELVMRVVDLREEIFNQNPPNATLLLNDLVTLSQMQRSAGQEADAIHTLRRALRISRCVIEEPAVESAALGIASRTFRTAVPESLRDLELAEQAARRATGQPDGQNASCWIELGEVLLARDKLGECHRAISAAELLLPATDHANLAVLTDLRARTEDPAPATAAPSGRE